MKQYFLNPGKTDASREGVTSQNAQQTIWKLKSTANQCQYYYETSVRFQEDRKFKYKQHDGGGKKKAISFMT
jgi:predicted S18 family serine protease